MPSLGIDLGAGLAAEFGNKLDAIAHIGKTQIDLHSRKYAPITGSIQGIGGQTAATVIQGPEAGKMWHVHRLSWGVATIGQAVGTPGTILIGKGTGLLSQAQGSGQLVAGQASNFIQVRSSTTVPGDTTWGRHQFILVYPMNLVVLWASGTAGVNLVLDGDAFEYLSETATYV